MRAVTDALAIDRAIVGASSLGDIINAQLADIDVPTLITA
jgi:hypothetical protein